MSSNIYTVGLQNAGSYRVSGQPYVVRRVINAGDEVKVEFPYVAKNITIRVPTPPNLAVQTVYGQGRFMTNPLTNTPPNPGVYELGSANVPAGSGSSDFTVSFWYKETETWVANKRPLTLTNQNVVKGEFRMKSAGSKYQYVQAGTVYANPPNGQTDWFRVTVTQLTSSTSLYFDSTHIATNGSNHDWWDDFQFPANSNGIGGGIDEVMVFNSGMTAAQVAELHNSGEYFNPNHHSLAANLLTWHTMGDVAGDGVDTNQEIRDLAGTNEPAHLFGTGDNSFIAGPWSTQTTGKIRVHTLSTGSTSGANIIGNNHFKEIQGYNQPYSFPMKGKEIYITAVGAQVTVEILAELTNIPTERMYALTGSGIDE
jgi:hypothetical protein